MGKFLPVKGLLFAGCFATNLAHGLCDGDFKKEFQSLRQEKPICVFHLNKFGDKDIEKILNLSFKANFGEISGWSS